MSKTNITSTSYGDMFGERNKGVSNGIVNATILIVLFSVLSGLFGYYLADGGKLRALGFGPRIEQTEELDPNATRYTEDQLNQKINRSAYDFDLYNQIIGNLKDKYVDLDKVNDQKLFEGSLKGMVDSIEDRATVYFSAKEYKDYQESLSGRFEGIGVRLEYQSNQVSVAEVLRGTPAEKAGVHAGYIFLKVDGKDVTTDSIEEVVSMVKGLAGTKVKISFYDPEKRDTIDKEIERAAVNVESMRLIEKDKDTVVFEVSRFTEDTVEEWNKKWDANVKDILSKNYKNIVLDLRGNGGGYLDSAIYAANDFLDPGKLIVSEKSRIRADKNTLSEKAPRLKDKKVVVLINGGTASASEILAGAIKYHKNYKILGIKSYGKGTVQNTWNLPNGGALKITTAYWLLPTGKRLDNDNPIIPDVEIKQDQSAFREGRDNVMEEALKLF